MKIHSDFAIKRFCIEFVLCQKIIQWFNAVVYNAVHSVSKLCKNIFTVFDIAFFASLSITVRNHASGQGRRGSASPWDEPNFSAAVLPVVVQQSGAPVKLQLISAYIKSKMWNFVWSWEIGKNDSKFIWCCQCQCQQQKQPIWEVNTNKATSWGNWFSFLRKSEILV